MPYIHVNPANHGPFADPQMSTRIKKLAEMGKIMAFTQLLDLLVNFIWLLRSQIIIDVLHLQPFTNWTPNFAIKHTFFSP